MTRKPFLGLASRLPTAAREQAHGSPRASPRWRPRAARALRARLTFNSLPISSGSQPERHRNSTSQPRPGPLHWGAAASPARPGPRLQHRTTSKAARTHQRPPPTRNNGVAVSRRLLQDIMIGLHVHHIHSHIASLQFKYLQEQRKMRRNCCVTVVIVTNVFLRGSTVL